MSLRLMNAIAKNVTLNTRLQQYWQLLRIMLFNLKTIGYVVAIFLSTGILGLVLMLIPSTNPLGIAFAILSFAIVLFVIGMGLPVGMVVILSNKHVSIIENLRGKLFHIIFSCGVLAAIIISSIILNTKKQAPTVDFVLMVMFVFAIYFWVTAYIGSKNTSIAVLTPLVAIFVVSFLSSFLIKMSAVYLVFVNLAVWYLFYRWWMSFNPYSASNKIKLLSLSQFNDPRFFSREPFFVSNKVRTPMGTLLLGYGDSYVTVLLRIGVIYLGSCVFSFYIFGVFKNGFSNDHLATAFLVGIGYSLVIVGMDFFGSNILNRIKRNWLFFTGNRENIYLCIEKLFWRAWVYLITLNLMVVILLLLVLHQYQDIAFGLRVILIIAFLLILNFYRDVYLYDKRLAIGEINFVKAAIGIIPFVAAICYLVSKYEHPDIIEWKDLLALLVVLIGVCSIKLIRTQCIKKWKSIDL